VAAATVERVTLSREIAGVGRLDFEQTEKRARTGCCPRATSAASACPRSPRSSAIRGPRARLLNWSGSIARARTPSAVRDESAGDRQGRAPLRRDVYERRGAAALRPTSAETAGPYLQGAARFLGEYAARAVHEGIERLICHPELRYAGRLDFLGVLNDSPALTLLDYKTSAGGNFYAKAHAQLAGYAVADKRCGGETIERYGVVGINEPGPACAYGRARSCAPSSATCAASATSRCRWP
jgi:hypothetical protein